VTADAADRVGVAAGWWQLDAGRSQDLASCSRRGVDMASWGFDLRVEEAEDQVLMAGTDDPIPCVEAARGVGIDSEGT
jgi:hypothetical protein